MLLPANGAKQYLSERQTEIAHCIMRQWCIDTLIKGKLRLRPFGCCGFDERGLSDSISTCRYGRSFWRLTLWKGTQRQCQITVLIFARPALVLWQNLQSRPSLLGHCSHSWRSPNQFPSVHVNQRLHFVISVCARESCVLPHSAALIELADGISWFVCVTHYTV